MNILDQEWLGVVALGIGVYLTWNLLRGGRKHRPVTSHDLTVFCLHCNWEGSVPRTAPRCRSCGGSNLSVVAT